jgi:hypothetical protein
MRPFLIKPVASLTESDFIEYPVWACYYEPDDVETLVNLGFDKREVEQALEATGYSDDYAFPLPPEAVHAPLNYIHCSVRATTRGGNKLVGYVTGPCVAVYFQGKLYSFNSNLRERSLATARELANALGEKVVFPMQLEVVATSAREEADLW